VPVDSSTVVYPGDPVPRFEVHSTIEREGFNLLEIHLGSQSGTHVDAPYHFEPDGLRVDEIPPDRFVGPGVVVDGSGLGARGVIDWEHVEPVADRLGPGVIVLLRTGWGRHYGTSTYFEHPYLGADACQRMLDLGVRTFCIEAINIDETPDEEHPGVGVDSDFRDPLTLADDVIEGGDTLLSARMRGRQLLDQYIRISSSLSTMMNNGFRIAHSPMGHHIFSVL